MLQLVQVKGLQPLTFRFVAGRSIQLSYTCTYLTGKNKMWKSIFLTYTVLTQYVLIETTVIIYF